MATRELVATGKWRGVMAQCMMRFGVEGATRGGAVLAHVGAGGRHAGHRLRAVPMDGIPLAHAAPRRTPRARVFAGRYLAMLYINPDVG